MNTNSKYTLFKLGYVFLPFLSFLLILKEYRAFWFKNALWMFIIFFGFSMSFLETIDAFAYKTMFEQFYSNYKFLDVFDTAKTGRIDFAAPLINYVLRIFTDNYHFLFGTYAVIFGFFYSRNIDFLLKQKKALYVKLSIGLIVFLSFYIGFWNINGFRFWTATHIFIFGIINYIYNEKKIKGIFFIGLSLTVHLSFVFPIIIIILIYNFIPRINKVFIIFTLLLTLYNPLSNLSLVETYLSQYAFNEQIESKIEVYTSDETVERSGKTSAKTDVFKIVSNFLMTAFILALAWILTPYFDTLKRSEIKFFKFGITLTLFSTILSFVPSLGGRFAMVGLFIILFSSITILTRYDFIRTKRKLLSRIGLLFSCLIIATNLWILFTFSFHTILGNFLTVFLDTEDVFYSVGDFLIGTFK